MSALLTPQQYLEFERRAKEKHEYYRGRMWARSRVNHAHCLIAVNILCSLVSQLREHDFNALGGNMRICTGPDGFYTYPDVLVYCGDARLLDAEEDTLLNPVLIAEVLLPSTEEYDRGFKFEQYSGMESLRECLLVCSERIQADLFTRQPDGQWQLISASRLEDTIEIPSLSCTLKLADIYDDVTF